MTEVFTLVGRAYPKPERADDLRKLLLSFVAPTREEPGCLEYHLHADRDDPAVLVFYEVWRSQGDLERHLELPHMKRFWESRMDYLERDLDIQYITMLSPYPGS
ncbi:MAG: putative quinol monooxygenase [Stackebrandtia sp.]